MTGWKRRTLHVAKAGEVWIIGLGMIAKVRPCLLLTDYPADDDLAHVTLLRDVPRGCGCVLASASERPKETRRGRSRRQTPMLTPFSDLPGIKQKAKDVAEG